MWDLTVYLIYPQWSGERGSSLPGFWSGRAPRPTIPPRRRDALWVYVRLVGDATVAPRTVEQLVDQVQQVFWQARGSVTGAMRQAAQSLHQRLQQVNRRLQPRGYRLEAHWAMAVWRADALYLGWCGPWWVLLVPPTGRAQSYPATATPGLGGAQMPELRWASVTFDLPQLVALLNPPEPTWEQDSLSLLQEPERVLNTWAAHLNRAYWGLVARWEPGSYRVQRHYQVLDVPWEETRSQAESLPAPSTSPPPQVPSPATTTEVATVPSRGPASTSALKASPARAGAQTAQRQHPSPAREKPRRQRHAPPPRWQRALLQGLIALLRWQLPTRPLVVLSLLLPLLVVGLTLGQYLQEGRWLRHRQWLALAYQQIQQAMQLPDPYQRGPAVERALQTLDQAERFGRSPESQRLRREALQWLDPWEGIQRLDFRPVLSGQVPEDFQALRLAPGTQGLFALDALRDQVWFFQLAANVHAFEPQPAFTCAGSRTYGGLHVGSLVDMVSVPGQPFPFEVAAFDAQGQWLSCRQDGPPQAHLLPMPTTRWGEIFRVRVFQEDLYLLDRKANNVFVVRLSRPQAAVPRALFPPNQGPDLTQAVDFALLRGEIFFLMVDGQVLRCAFALGEQDPPQCEYLLYQDQRLEREGQLPVLPNTRFRALEVYPGPEPGLLFLDTQGPAIYHFTLKLRFLAQYRPRSPWPMPPQAFTTTSLFQPRPYLYVTVGPHLYAAPLP